MSDLIERLRAASCGREEWRVANPADGSYCMSADRSDSFDPERDCREWLADHIKKFPNGRYVGYEVRRVTVLSGADVLMQVAALELERLTKERDEWQRQFLNLSNGLATDLPRAEAERDAAVSALHKINDIRNSIIGVQSFNWSEHMYPLVDILEGAGIEGQPYPEARAYVGTLIEHVKALESERDALAHQVLALRQMADDLLGDYRGAARNSWYKSTRMVWGEVLRGIGTDSAVNALAERDAAVLEEAAEHILDRWCENGTESVSMALRRFAAEKREAAK